MIVKPGKKQILSNALIIAIIIIGFLIGIKLSYNQYIAGGILGMALVYYSYRIIFKPEKIGIEIAYKQSQFQSPKNIWDLAASLSFAIVLTIALQQIINLLSWFINLIRN